LIDLLLGAAGDRQSGQDDGREFGAADDAHDVHSGASIASVGVATGSRAQSLRIESIGALAFWWSMIFSENRYPLFGIML
jgi:hypothetical protein